MAAAMRIQHLIIYQRYIQRASSMAADELIEFLIDSARYGDTEDVALAIKEGVNVDATDGSGRTGTAAG